MEWRGNPRPKEFCKYRNFKLRTPIQNDKGFEPNQLSARGYEDGKARTSEVTVRQTDYRLQPSGVFNGPKSLRPQSTRSGCSRVAAYRQQKNCHCRGAKKLSLNWRHSTHIAGIGCGHLGDRCAAEIVGTERQVPRNSMVTVSEYK